jgi:predicted proteasome-type protease
MAKIIKKISASVKAARKAAKLECQKKYKTVFINGKQVRVERPQLIEGIPVDDFISQNADPIWLQQNEMWEENED